MATEIERKFLLADGITAAAIAARATKASRIAQGYLASDPQRTVRVRIKGEQGFLTVKGKNDGISRLEFEYAVPLADAEAMLALCTTPLIEKTRYLIPQGELVWEVDVFAGDNAGLIVAEIELPTDDFPFERPDWVGVEVSGDPRYYNSSLQRAPYRTWAD